MNKTIIFRSGFDDGNAADELELEVLRSWFPNYKHKVMVRKPSKRYEELHPGIETIERLEHYSFADAKGRNFRGFNYSDSMIPIDNILEHLHEASLLLIGHGSYFNVHHKSIARGNLSEMALMIWFAQMTGTPVVLTGMSATGLDSDVSLWAKCLIVWILDNVDGCIFRDERSQIVLSHLTETAKTFPVYEDSLLSYKYKNNCLGNPYLLGIAPRNISHLSTQIDEGVTAILIETIYNYLKLDKRNKVRLIPQLISIDVNDKNCDYQRCHEILNRSKSSQSHRIEVVTPTRDKYWLDTLDAYSDLYHLIAIRHHASIFGILNSVPNIIPISYDDKVEGFWNTYRYYPIALKDLKITTLLSKIVEHRGAYGSDILNESNQTEIGKEYKTYIERRIK